jgi:hypothetical protein
MDRIYHPWDKWECYHSGFWNTTCPNGMKEKEGIEIYRDFLSDVDQFESGLQGVLNNWPYSCEHNLTNESMNRIAWLGQASVAYKKGIPSHCRSGFTKMTEEQQHNANHLALKYLNIWLKSKNYEEATAESCKMKTKQPKF